MTDYLALLKARCGQRHIPEGPSKLTKPGFVGFDGDLGRHFLQTTNVSEQAEGGPTTGYLARLKARPRQERIPEGASKLTKPGFVGFDSDLGGHFPQAINAAASAASPPLSSAPGHNEAHEERSAVVEFCSGAPRAWAEGLARLDPSRPPNDVPHQRWLRFIDGTGRFLSDGWAAKAAVLGWRAVDLFGCDRHRPWARIDRAGLLWLMAGRRLVALTTDTATIETASGGSQRYHRVHNGSSRVLVWSLCDGATDDTASQEATNP
jgi:hypothetical protein